jgi:acetolactate synthase regulatory subunit
MQWLMALETNRDPITGCRLMNIFRRKGVSIVTLAMASRPEGFSVVAVVETPESEVEHIFNFLRRVEGVQHVTYYRHEPLGDASFVFIDADADSSSIARFLQTFPESKLIFASNGKYLLEIPGDRKSRVASLDFGKQEILPFARVKTSIPQPELITARAS